MSLNEILDIIIFGSIIYLGMVAPLLWLFLVVHSLAVKNHAITISALLLLLAFSPSIISKFQFAQSGGMGWPMIWGNEALAWSLMLSPLVFVSGYIAIQSKDSKKLTKIAVLASCLLVTLHSWPDFIRLGFEITASSKGDVEYLELMQFWFSGWWV